MQKEKALRLAAFFAEFEQKMIRRNRPKIADFSNKQMMKCCKSYLDTKVTL